MKKKNFIENNLTSTPPKGSRLKVGDKVRWINANGVEWTHTVIGFNTSREYNREYKAYVHLDTDSYWFPHKEEDLMDPRIDDYQKLASIPSLNNGEYVKT